MRFLTSTYGAEIDALTREIERLSEIAKLYPQRANEIEHGRALLARLKSQMRRHGKRRSSCFYGYDEVAA